MTKPVSLALPIAGASTVPVQQVSCLSWEETRKFKSQTQLVKPPRVRASKQLGQASELSDCVDGSFTSEGIGTTCKPEAALWRSVTAWTALSLRRILCEPPHSRNGQNLGAIGPQPPQKGYK